MRRPHEKIRCDTCEYFDGDRCKYHTPTYEIESGAGFDDVTYLRWHRVDVDEWCHFWAPRGHMVNWLLDEQGEDLA